MAGITVIRPGSSKLRAFPKIAVRNMDATRSQYIGAPVISIFIAWWAIQWKLSFVLNAKSVLSLQQVVTALLAIVITRPSCRTLL